MSTEHYTSTVMSHDEHHMSTEHRMSAVMSHDEHHMSTEHRMSAVMPHDEHHMSTPTEHRMSAVMPHDEHHMSTEHRMSIVMPRTCTVLPGGGADRPGITDRPDTGSKPLREFRSIPAYVLLGDPGTGKTTEFEQECRELGETAAVCISARTFIALYRDLDADSLRSQLGDKVLFIDGLDEVRAGQTDSRIPLDKILGLIHRISRPRFRISCREADWLGSNDRQNLATVSPNSEIVVLHLDPLSEQSAMELLESQYGVPDSPAFIARARRLGLGAMLHNPLTLKLLASAVSRGGEWPRDSAGDFREGLPQDGR